MYDSLYSEVYKIYKTKWEDLGLNLVYIDRKFYYYY